MGDLPAGEVDRMPGGQPPVDQRVGLAEADCAVAAVVIGLLLLDQVGVQRDAEVGWLAR